MKSILDGYTFDELPAESKQYVLDRWRKPNSGYELESDEVIIRTIKERKYKYSIWGETIGPWMYRIGSEWSPIQYRLLTRELLEELEGQGGKQ